LVCEVVDGAKVVREAVLGGAAAVVGGGAVVGAGALVARMVVLGAVVSRADEHAVAAISRVAAARFAAARERSEGRGTGAR
jgi:hypothetical protein